MHVLNDFKGHDRVNEEAARLFLRYGKALALLPDISNFIVTP